MNGYDVTVLTPGEVRVIHQDGPIETDGPWLILHENTKTDTPRYLFPAHAVAAVEPCPGEACRGIS